jgi:hypothetical protein
MEASNRLKVKIWRCEVQLGAGSGVADTIRSTRSAILGSLGNHPAEPFYKSGSSSAEGEPSALVSSAFQRMKLTH